jgi:hypothetical protein
MKCLCPQSMSRQKTTMVSTAILGTTTATTTTTIELPTNRRSNGPRIHDEPPAVGRPTHGRTPQRDIHCVPHLRLPRVNFTAHRDVDHLWTCTRHVRLSDGSSMRAGRPRTERSLMASLEEVPLDVGRWRKRETRTQKSLCTRYISFFRGSLSDLIQATDPTYRLTPRRRAQI